MSIFGEFTIPATAFAFSETFAAEPETVIEIERVVATDEEYLTPYFWVSGVSAEAFEAAAEGDGSVSGLRELDRSDSMILFRAVWRDHVEAVVYAYTRVGASILEAKGHSEEWLLRMRFDARENIESFTEYLDGSDVSFRLERLHEIENPAVGGQYGLTRKQQEALVTAWEMGFFDLPRESSMAAVADELGITAQSLSDRLRRGQHSLVGNTLRVTVADERTADEPPPT